MPALILHIGVTVVLLICAGVIIAAVVGGLTLWRAHDRSTGITLIASGVVAFVVAGAQLAIENDRDLQDQRQSFQLAVIQATDLTGANFSSRDLRGFFFIDKEMPFVKFVGSDMTQTLFRCDNLEDVHFRAAGGHRTELAGVQFTGVDLGGAQFEQAALQDSRWTLVVAAPVPAGIGGTTKTDLARADLSHVVMFNVWLPGAVADRVRFDHATLYDVSLMGADLRKASLRDATLGGPAYPTGGLRAGKHAFGPVDLRDAQLQNAQLQGADLQHTYLFGANLSGAVADRRTKLPHGFVLSHDGRDHVVQEFDHAPRVLPAISRPESPCTSSFRPPRFS
jgi:uncharacterized protein YjbI with pentapeptide repeats